MAKTTSGSKARSAGPSPSVKRFGRQQPLQSQGHRLELSKDNVPLRRGELKNDMNIEQRKATIKEFQQRVGVQSGDRDKMGVAHVEDVAAKKQQLQQSTSVQRFQRSHVQAQAISRTQATPQSQGISR